MYYFFKIICYGLEQNLIIKNFELLYIFSLMLNNYEYKNFINNF